MVDAGVFSAQVSRPSVGVAVLLMETRLAVEQSLRLDCRFALPFSRLTHLFNLSWLARNIYATYPAGKAFNSRRHQIWMQRERNCVGRRCCQRRIDRENVLQMFYGPGPPDHQRAAPWQLRKDGPHWRAEMHLTGRAAEKRIEEDAPEEPREEWMRWTTPTDVGYLSWQREWIRLG